MALITALISSGGLVLGSVIGAVCSFFVNKVSMHEQMKLQHENLMYQESCNAKEKYTNANIIRLDFCNAIRKISIASSMGGYIISKQEKNVFRELLSKYDYISVREKFTKNQIEGIVDKNIYTILDPTLLIDATEWREIVVDNKKYIKYKF